MVLGGGAPMVVASLAMASANLVGGAFTSSAVYLTTDPERPNLAYHSPEMSQRARGLPVWATLPATPMPGGSR